MNKKIAIILLGSLVTMTSCVYQAFQNREGSQCEKKIAPIRSYNFNFQNKKSPLDTAIVKINNRAYFVVAYMTSPGVTPSSSPVYLYPMNENGEIVSRPMQFGETQHIRDIVSINTPWGDGVLMADHGVDGNGFPGGNLILLVVDKRDQKLIDMSNELHQSKNFAFNVAAVRRTHSKYDDILVAPYNSPNARVVYLKATDKGYVSAPEVLPKEWRNFNFCFMTAKALDVDHDGRDEIVLGSCDQPRDRKLSVSDRLLKWKDSRWIFASEDTFPLRKQDPTWGTVYWYKDEKNLIGLTHNNGFTKADIQFFSFDDRRQKFSETPVTLTTAKREKSSFYFHKIQKFKDVFYGLIRYGSTNFEGPNLLALAQEKSGAWKERDVCLVTPPKEVVLGIDTFTNDKGKSLLILTYYSGRYDVFE